MKSKLLRILFFAFVFCGIANLADAQKRKSTKRTTNTKTSTKINATTPAVDSVAPTAAVAEKTEPAKDSLPIKKIKPSLRADEAVETSALRDRTPLAYEHLRADDAVYRHRIWRELDVREKMNNAFTYAADADNGNQRFISILLQALADSTKGITAFSSIDDRFTTPMTITEISKAVLGDEIEVPQFDSVGNPLPPKKMRPELNYDSLYIFHIKEEVIFDKESSRLFWRILGIAPVKNVKNSNGDFLGTTEVFWIYYPDLRPVLSTYEVYNGKNYGNRMSWEELFESRMFSARIIKSSMDNPRNIEIKNFPGLTDNGILQLFEGENIKEKIFNYEQDQWSY